MLPLDAASPARLTGFWDWPGWTALVAIGTLALAAGTGVLASITSCSVGQTKNLVEETKQLVSETKGLGEATEKLASATEQTVAEVRRDRELEYQPYISWKLLDVQTQNQVITAPGRATVANFGRGPAIHCLCCATWMSGGPGNTPNSPTPFFGSTDLFDLSPSEDGQVPLNQRSGWVPDDSIAGVPVAADPPNRLAFCRDHLGTYYRFAAYEPTATWREGDGDRPRWVSFYLEHFTNLRKA